jgi:hypothetical protein
LRRAALALLIGAASGAVTITALHLPRDLSYVVGMLLVDFILFATGLLILAAPAWWVSHRLCLRGRIQAVILGVTLTLTSYLACSEYFRHFTVKAFIGPAPISWTAGLSWPAEVARRSRLSYWLTFLEGAIWYSIVGGLVGLLIWSIAYRRSAPKA